MFSRDQKILNAIIKGSWLAFLIWSAFILYLLLFWDRVEADVVGHKKYSCGKPSHTCYSVLAKYDVGNKSYIVESWRKERKQRRLKGVVLLRSENEPSRAFFLFRYGLVELSLIFASLIALLYMLKFIMRRSTSR